MEKVLRGAPGCFQGIRVYIDERSRSVELRGAHEGGGRTYPLGAPSCLVAASGVPDFNSKSPGSRSVRKSRSRRFHSVWTPFDIPFLWNTEIGKKQQFWAGPPVNRLVPKII